MLQSELLKKLSKKMVTEPDNYMSSLRQNLQIFLGEKGMSMAELSEAAGISVETLKTILYGKSEDCKLSTVIALAKALNISIDELTGAGTLPEVVKESIQITRNLPDTHVYFIRWAIRFHERMLSEKKITCKAINVMTPEYTKNGNIRLSNNFNLYDIGDLEEYIRYKVFMGIVVPCDNYMPVLAKGDILLLANDRSPLQEDMVVVVTDGFAKVVNRREEKIDGKKIAKYYSIWSGQLIGEESDIEEIIGYVAKVQRN